MLILLENQDTLKHSVNWSCIVLALVPTVLLVHSLLFVYVENRGIENASGFTSVTYSETGQGSTRYSLFRGQPSFVLPSVAILDFAGAGAWAWDLRLVIGNRQHGSKALSFQIQISYAHIQLIQRFSQAGAIQGGGWRDKFIVRTIVDLERSCFSRVPLGRSHISVASRELQLLKKAFPRWY